MKQEQDLIYLPAWIYIIKDIKAGYNITKISKERNISYSHVSKIVAKLSEERMIDKKPEGRITKLNFTYKGNKISNTIIRLIKEMEAKE